MRNFLRLSTTSLLAILLIGSLLSTSSAVTFITVNRTGEDYATLSAAQAGESGGLTEPMVIECYDDDGVLNDSPDFTGWLTGATYYLMITAPLVASVGGTDERHNGVRTSGASGTGFVMTIDNHFITGFDISGIGSGGVCFVEGIQIDLASRASFCFGGTAESDAIVYFDDCIAWSEATAHGESRAFSSGSTQPTVIRNCISDNGGARGFTISSAVINSTAYTASIYGFGNATADIATAINCLSFNTSDDFNTGNAWVLIDYCATDDGDGTNAVTITQSASDYAALVSSATAGDFTPTDASSELYNAGFDVSSLFGGVTDDIIGTSRPQSTDFDIGAWEFISVAPTPSGEAIPQIRSSGFLNILGSPF